MDVVIQGGASSAPPVLSIDSASLSFGAVQVGSSRDLTLTVTNTGAGTLTGTATPSVSFSVLSGSPFSLGAGQSQVVTVRFAPNAIVTFVGQLSVTTNAGNATVQLSGTGTAPPAPVVGLSTNVLVFPNTTINANSLPAPITITNIGSSALILGTASLAGANPVDFVIAGDSCSGVTLTPAPAAGSSCTLSVSFGPTLLGTRSANLSIPSNAAGSPSSVSLSGTGLAAPAPAATLSTSSLTFASQVVGSNSLPQSVTLTNTGTANLLLGTLSISGTNPGDYLIVTNTCTNATLIPNATCAFSVSFQPTATGTRTASVAISSNAAGSPHSVSLSGTGAAPAAPAATLSVGSLTYGPLTVGSSSAAQSVVLTNSGTANLVLGVLSLSGANPSDYSVATNTCNNTTLAPGATCVFGVTFTPTALGTRAATVSISSNAIGSPHSVGLAGTGIALPPPPAPCGGQAVTWTVSTSTCTATYPGGQSGTSTLLSDATGPTTGTVTASCTNGLLALNLPLCAATLPPKPRIDSIDSPRGAKGTVLTIVGEFFALLQGMTTVKFGATEGLIGLNSTDTNLVVQVPDGAQGPVSVTVTTAAGGSNALTFFYTNAEFQIVEETDSKSVLTEPSLAVDPKDPDHAVVGFNDVDILGAVSCGWAETLNGGKTWKKGAMPFPVGVNGSGDPWIRFMPNTNQLMYSCIGTRVSANTKMKGIYVAVSATQFAKDLKLPSPKPVVETSEPRGIDRPSFGFILMGGRLRTVACWTLGNEHASSSITANYRIQNAYSDDIADLNPVWSKANSVAKNNYPSFCSMGGNGVDKIGVSWFERNDNVGTGTLYLRTSIDGNKWSKPVQLDTTDMWNNLENKFSASTTTRLTSNPYAQILPGDSANSLATVWQRRRAQRSEIVVGTIQIDNKLVPTVIDVRVVAGAESFLPGTGACGRIAGGYQFSESSSTQFNFKVWPTKNLSSPLFATTFSSDFHDINPDTPSDPSSRRIGDYMGADCSSGIGWAAWTEVRRNKRLEIWGAKFSIQ